MSQICSCQVLGAELGVGDATVGKGDDVPTVLHVLFSLGKQTRGKKKMQINTPVWQLWLGIGVMAVVMAMSLRHFF